MKTTKSLIFLILAAILLSSCAKVYYSPDAKTLALNHKSLAIIPPSVSIAPPRRNADVNVLKEQQKIESLNFQKEMYAWLLKRKMQGKVMPEILDIETTNSKLKKAGYPDNPLTPAELCRILGVDAVMGSNYYLSKPMSEGAAIAVGIIFGMWGSPNEVTVSLNLQDCENTKLIWNYDHKYSGSIGSSPAQLVDGLMRNASKKMPYSLN